jgi:hypothetical protein
VPFLQPGHFSLLRDQLALDLVVSHCSHQILSDLLFHVSCVSSIDEHRVAVLISQIVVALKRDHTMIVAQLLEIGVNKRIVGVSSERTAADCDVIEQSTRSAVGSVNRAEVSPTLGEEFSDGGGFHFCEVGASMYGSEMREEPHVIEFISNDAEPFVLHEIKTSPGLEGAG